MSFLSETPTLFSARLQVDNPIIVTPDINFGDENPSETILNVGKIKTQLLTQKYKIEWPEIQGAKFYRLYGSVNPARQANLLEDNITGVSTFFVPPVLTPVIQYYFWVSVVLKNGSEEYLTDDPATLETARHTLAFDPNPISDGGDIIPDADGLNCEMPGIFEYIRAGNRFQLENDGEQALLFQCRHAEDRPFGVPCECNNSLQAQTNPDYLGRGRCGLCFGTGIYGGYYPSVPIMIRYSNLPSQRYQYTKTGYELQHSFNTFMLWAPQVRVGDLVIRLLDGTRYLVTDRNESSARGIRLHQEFNLQQIDAQSIKNDVTDQQIADALNQLEVPGFVWDGFKVFG